MRIDNHSLLRLGIAEKDVLCGCGLENHLAVGADSISQHIDRAGVINVDDWLTILQLLARQVNVLVAGFDLVNDMEDKAVLEDRPILTFLEIAAPILGVGASWTVST